MGIAALTAAELPPPRALPLTAARALWALALGRDLPGVTWQAWRIRSLPSPSASSALCT
ncbi:MAG TPA: hypothetical protein VG963_34105 [Polyangiaceae bacterium]|nr:hypothetical protein [Polyangiaceae bacterium]